MKGFRVEITYGEVDGTKELTIPHLVFVKHIPSSEHERKEIFRTIRNMLQDMETTLRNINEGH